MENMACCSAVDVLKTLSALVADVVPFKEEWKNGTGYLNGAASDKSISSSARFTDDKGRMGVILHTLEYGNIVIFERYAAIDNKVVVSNMSMTWQYIMDKKCQYTGGAMTPHQVLKAFALAL